MKRKIIRILFLKHVCAVAVAPTTAVFPRRTPHSAGVVGPAHHLVVGGARPGPITHVSRCGLNTAAGDRRSVQSDRTVLSCHLGAAPGGRRAEVQSMKVHERGRRSSENGLPPVKYSTTGRVLVSTPLESPGVQVGTVQHL